MAAELRRLGQNIEKASYAIYDNIGDFAKATGLSVADTYKLFEGRLMLVPSKLKEIANLVNKSLLELLDINGDYTFVECMGSFRDKKNEDKILDMIDDYIDLSEAISWL